MKDKPSLKTTLSETSPSHFMQNKPIAKRQPSLKITSAWFLNLSVKRGTPLYQTNKDQPTRPGRWAWPWRGCTPDTRRFQWRTWAARCPSCHVRRPAIAAFASLLQPASLDVAPAVQSHKQIESKIIQMIQLQWKMGHPQVEWKMGHQQLQWRIGHLHCHKWSENWITNSYSEE